MKRKEREWECGIRLFSRDFDNSISKLHRIKGKLKLYPYDFHVNEIFHQKIISYDNNLPNENLSQKRSTSNPFQNVKEGLEKLKKLLGKYGCSKNEFEELEKCLGGQGSSVFVDLPFWIENRQDRKVLHEFLMNYFESFSYCKSEKENNLRIFKDEKGREWKIRFKKRKREKRFGRFVQFVMWKINIGTKAAISKIYDYLRLTKKLEIEKVKFSFCGMKDKDAITTQLVCVSNLDASELYDFNEYRKEIEKKGMESGVIIRIGSFKRIKKELKYGMANGNQFKIVLRDLEMLGSMKHEDLGILLNRIRTCGIFNYFGLQRFGNDNILNYRFGIEILKLNWKKVIELYLCREKKSYKKSSLEVHKELLSFWKTRDYEKALKFLQEKKEIFYEFYEEAKIIEYLQKKLTDVENEGKVYCDCFHKCVPYFLRSFFVHSYCSFIWNCSVSMRFEKESSFSVLIGDVVMKKDQSVVVIEGEEQIKKFSVYDTVIPLVGSSIKFPKNQYLNKEKVESLLRKDGVELESFDKLYELYPKDYQIRGTYRRVLTKPKTLEWEIVNFGNDEPMFDSSVKLIDSCSEIQTCDKKALLLSFQLPSGSYATMLVREIER